MKIVKLKVRTFVCEGDEAGGKVTIKHLNPGEVSDIIDIVVSQRVEYKKGKSDVLEPTFISETDKKLDREETAVRAISGWENFYDEDGKTLECTDENKVLAMRKIEGFAEFISRCRMILARDIINEQRSQRKN